MIRLEPEKIYHLYNHGNAEDNLFREEKNYSYFLLKYGEYINPIAETFAYCLMPNHFHFLIRIKEEEALRKVLKIKNPTGLTDLSGLISRRFSNFFNAYAKAYNKRFERVGRLFRSSMKRKLVSDETYLVRLVHYIHYNPVHHGFVKEMEDWTFSSYHAFRSEKKTRLSRNEVIGWFGDQTEFDKMHRWKPELEEEFY